MILTPAQHLKAAQQARLASHHHDVASHFAAERGDTIGAFEALSEKHFHDAVAAHHEAQAATMPAEPVIEGLTDGRIHLSTDNRPSDDAIVEG